MDRICHVDPKALFTQVQKLGLPFNEWPKWVEKELGRIYLEKLYDERHATRIHNLKQSLAVKKEVLTHHYYAEFKTIHDYFYTEVNKA